LRVFNQSKPGCLLFPNKVGKELRISQKSLLSCGTIIALYEPGIYEEPFINANTLAHSEAFGFLLFAGVHQELAGKKRLGVCPEGGEAS
jgi:hypothetical protein